MGRRQNDDRRGACALAIVLLMGIASCVLAFRCLIGGDDIPASSSNLSSASNLVVHGGADFKSRECCRGIDHSELWGDVVKWGSDFKFNSSRECCLACKSMDLCDSWVFCGDSKACGPKFGECWLKKQEDILNPDQRVSGDQVMWTSGLVFGQKQLLPACAPLSVKYIFELLASRSCVGCQFHRAESRGSFWLSNGDHVENAPYGPPFAVIQGTLEAHGIMFKKIPKEHCPTIRRGSVAWVGSGPEFFISLANHGEWRSSYTVFGSVLPADMEMVEKLAQLPTTSEVWHNINVSVLEKPIPLQLKRMNIEL